MPLYLIERNFAERLIADRESVGRTLDVNRETGVHWLFSFLSADALKTYCLYEAPNPEAIRDAARRLGIPADVIVEVSDLNPSMYLEQDEIADRSGVAGATPSVRRSGTSGAPASTRNEAPG